MYNIYVCIYIYFKYIYIYIYIYSAGANLEIGGAWDAWDENPERAGVSSFRFLQRFPHESSSLYPRQVAATPIPCSTFTLTVNLTLGSG